VVAQAGTKGARTRERLLEIAVRRFAADGYRATSVSAVAREAGLTPAAAYAYFPGKEALFAAAVDADAEALIAGAPVAVGGDATVRAQLPAVVAHLVAGLQDHPLARRVLAGHEPDEIGRLLDLPALVALRDLTAEALAVDRARGRLAAHADPATLALGIETVVLTLLMAGLQAGLEQDAERLDARATGVLTVLDEALAPPPGG